MNLNEKIGLFCKEKEQEFHLISAERKDKLLALSNYITQKNKEEKQVSIIVICTHNSRRSHAGQLFLAVGVDYFELSNIETFSGGTEATIFNNNAINALRKIGFQISVQDEVSINSRYEVRWKEFMKPYIAFSKKYGDTPNPKSEFAAIMVCSEADEECPIVFGCDFRLSLPYEDPKKFDGTDLDIIKYEERFTEIGREMLYALSQVE